MKNILIGANMGKILVIILALFVLNHLRIIYVAATGYESPAEDKRITEFNDQIIRDRIEIAEASRKVVKNERY